MVSTIFKGVSKMISNILNKFYNGEILSKEDLLNLLKINVGSSDYYKLLATANNYSRTSFSSKGTVFGQIGLDNQPCRINCKFCSLAANVREKLPCQIRSIEDTVHEAKTMVDAGVDDVFLMTTAEFSQEKFLDYCVAVRKVLPASTRLVANVGDFDLEYAKRLKGSGVTGAYHICRLGEEIDTETTLSKRMKTLDAVRDAGLELYYCVEPIGPEHTDDQLVTEMMRTRDYPVGVMAVMKRTAVPGTLLAYRGEISAARLAQICAITTLAMRPSRAMGVHEPDELCLMAGANQIYAEFGTNPRDTEEETSKSRGYSVAQARALLKKAEWI